MMVSCTHLLTDSFPDTTCSHNALPMAQHSLIVLWSPAQSRSNFLALRCHSSPNLGYCYFHNYRYLPLDYFLTDIVLKGIYYFLFRIFHHPTSSYYDMAVNSCDRMNGKISERWSKCVIQHGLAL
jgi:hypothetical protein